MPIDIVCSGCQRKLRVPDRVAGKRIKCPKCEAVVAVPASSSSESSPGKAASSEKKWYMKGENGQRYGPVPKAELDGWVKEGRITSESQVLEEGSDQWQWATDIYPSLTGGEATTPEDDNPFAGIGGQTQPSEGEGGQFDFGGGGPSISSRAGGGRKRKTKSTTKANLAEAGQRSKMAAGLLGIFLGGLGVHRFYLGYTKMGIIQIAVTICTFGVGQIWGIVEGIKILTGSFDRDADGRSLRN